MVHGRSETKRLTKAQARREASRCGEEMAELCLERVPPRPRGKQNSGVLLAEGDSWFDYPFYDVLGELEDRHGYEVYGSVAKRGDTVEDMAYDVNQLGKVARMFQKVAGRLRKEERAPRAILLSGGGNDIAGGELAVLLNHARSGQPVLHDRIVQGVITERLGLAMTTLISAVTALSEGYFQKTLPIVLHGYAHPVPDGRGYKGGWGPLPGPWLEPGFRQKGHNDTRRNTEVMEQLIDVFNEMIRGVARARGHGHVSYVDLRDVLVNSPRSYEKDWSNELHPTRQGFRKVAAAFDAHIKGL